MIGRDSADGGRGAVGEVEQGGVVGGVGRRGSSGEALQSPRRKSMAKTKVTPAIAAARQFASSNTTVNAFMGGKYKSWMTSSGDINASSTFNKQSSQKRPLPRQTPTSLNQSTLPHPPPLASPNVHTTFSQQAFIPPLEAGGLSVFPTPATAIHPASNPVSHPPGPTSVGHSPALQSMGRTDIQPPSNSTSPLLANTVSIQKESGNSESSGNNQTLPSPTPSDDAAQGHRQGSDLASTRYESGEQQSGASGAADSPFPHAQDLPQAQVNAQQSPDPMDTQPHPELSEKLDELRKQYGADKVNNFLRLSESARASPSEGTSGVSSGHSSLPSKRPADSLSERYQTESLPHSPATQFAQNPNASAADKRIRIQADPSLSSSSSPRLSMTNSPSLVQGQFQHLPHGQVQGQILDQASNQAPTQAPNQVPNQILMQVLDQVNTHATDPYGNGPPSAGLPPHGTQTPTQTSHVPSQQRNAPTITTTPMFPPGYSLQEKRNQIICGTTPDRHPPTSQNPNRLTLTKFLPIIEREMRLSMEQNTEVPRMKLLLEACQEEDWFYVALHQMYCVSSVQQQGLASMVGLSPKQLEGFQVIKELIMDNHLLSKGRLAWFTQFPSPLGALYSRSDLYRHAVGLVKDFLSVLPETYARFQHECRGRRTPPLVHELVICMKLQSMIFQRVVYIAIRRRMWGPIEDEYTTRMLEIFRENQRDYLALLDKQDTAHPASIQSIVNAHQRIAYEYNNTRALQLGHRGANSQTSQNSLAQAQQAFRSFMASQPPVPSPQQQNGLQEPNGQSISSAATANVFPSQLPPAQSYNPINASQNPMALTAPRRLSVNTQAAQQHPSSGLPSSGRGTYPSSAQTPIATSPATPGLTNQMQMMQMQRLRQQQDSLDRQRRVGQIGQHRQNTRTVVPSQISLQAVPPPSPGTAPLPNGSPAPIPLNRRLVVASVPAGAPDPRYPPMLGGFPSGGTSGSPRQHPSNFNRPGHNRTRGSQGSSQLQVPLVPPSNFTPSTAPGLPNPTYTALHQSHIRSPYLKCATPPPTDGETKLYQYIRGFPLQPTIFPRDRPLLSYSFHLPITDFGYIARSGIGALHDKRDLRRIRIVRPGSLMYRIRCVKLSSVGLPNEDKWVTTESKWPDHIFIDVNQTKMETRRKLHFGKDLPIDITDHVTVGENNLKVSILRSQREINAHYAIAIEAIEVITHAEILKFANENFIPAQQSLDAIKTSLTAIPDDDDIAVVNNDLTINISDPFSARVFNIPARGRSCLHRECFDLETFLATRASKPKRTNEPCMADEWKCPLCAGDARPHRLLIDGFLADVKKELDSRGFDETRAIVVDKGGGWAPKVEPGDEDSKREGSAASVIATSAAAGRRNASPTKDKVVVVIDLEDD